MPFSFLFSPKELNDEQRFHLFLIHKANWVKHLVKV